MRTYIKQAIPTLVAALIVVAPVAHAEATPAATRQADRLEQVKSRGGAEINRRLSTLNALAGRISGAAKLSSADKTTLTNEVSSEIHDLTLLKAKLDAETVLASAFADAKAIVTEYRVYALVVPKVGLVRAADDQQVVESKLVALEAKLRTRIAAAQNAGKHVDSLQVQLDDLASKVSAAQTISPTVEAEVIALQPTDFNSDHAVLSGYRDQLSVAHRDNQAALMDVREIIDQLKAL